MKIGSLFDGSGGFPLAASMCGIEPVWAAEIEPYPIAVTRSRFPNMKHLGSVTDVRGDEVEPVDVITFGSPCQDLSVAGKRAGLKHTENGDEETTRSGLFMEAIRIIKEMRKATNGVYPRFAVWENVPGAFSSNKGEDFRIVLEEFVKVVEPTAVMPTVPKNGWPYADSYRGDGWSISYRVFDAQFWGVPQRRRRIYLVADFGGQCAGKVSFEREGLQGYFAESGASWKRTACDAEDCSGAADREGDCGVTAYSVDNQMAVAYCTKEQHLFENHSQDSRYKGPLDVCPMLPAQLGTGGNNQPFVVESTLASGKDVTGCPMASGYEKLGAQEMFSGDYTVIEKQPVFCLEGNGSRPSHSGDGWRETETMYTLNTIEQHAVAYADPIVLDRAFYNQGQNAQYEPQYYEDGTVPTLVAKGPSAVAYWDGSQTCGTLTANNAGGSQRMPDKENFNCVIETKIHPTCDEVHEFIADNNADAPHQQDLLQAADGVARTIACGTHAAGSHLTKTVINYGTHYIVRRLTPTECARLQGFPDKWGHTDIKETLSDEEYAFWLNVRNTHAETNGKATKEYTREQMLAWYNKLHTDSAEYKLWGNGIALPCALYVMQGIAEVLDEN